MKSNCQLLALQPSLVMLAAVLFGSAGCEQKSAPMVPRPSLSLTDGWLNSQSDVTDADLAGKWVVIDCWATWCPPCRKALPELAQLYPELADQGIVLLGITPEGASDAATIAELVDNVEGFDWPVGYGGQPILDVLQVYGIPSLHLFAPDGRQVWSGHGVGELRQAIDKFVARAP